MANPVTLQIEFTGSDPEQRAAFDRASSDAATQAAHDNPQSVDNAKKPEPSPATNAAFVEALDDVLGTNKSASQQSEVGKPEEQAIDSIEQLIRKIDELISSDRVQGKSKGEKSEKPEETGIAKLLSNLDDSVNKKIESLGLEGTRAGKIVSGLSGAVKKYGNKLASSKVGKSVAGMLGRGAAAAGAEAAGGAAAGAGAGAGIAAAAGPIAAVAVAAAGAALTVKALSDAVQSAANELVDLSPELAGVRAQFQLTRELARLDRADRIGAGAAQLEAARSRIDESMYDVQTKILELILKFSPILEAMLDGVNIGVRGIDTVIATLNVLASILTVNDPTDDAPARAALAQSAGDLAKALQEFVTNNSEPQGAIDPFLAEILNMPGNPPPLPRFPKAGGRP